MKDKIIYVSLPILCITMIIEIILLVMGLLGSFTVFWFVMMIKLSTLIATVFYLNYTLEHYYRQFYSYPKPYVIGRLPRTIDKLHKQFNLYQDVFVRSCNRSFIMTCVIGGVSLFFDWIYFFIGVAYTFN